MERGLQDSGCLNSGITSAPPRSVVVELQTAGEGAVSQSVSGQGENLAADVSMSQLAASAFAFLPACLPVLSPCGSWLPRLPPTASCLQ